MPELPEVETVKRQLNKVIKNQRVEKIKVLREKSFQGIFSKAVKREIKEVKRRAKLLIIEFKDKPGLNILIHLKMTGQLVYVPRRGQRVAGGHPTADWVKKLPSKHTRVILELTKGTLFFNDMRVFGWMKIVGGEALNRELRRFGPDVTSKEFDKKYLRKILESSRRTVKLILLDQTKVGGLGNIYVNDGLFWAGVNPMTRGSKLALDNKKLQSLFIGLKRVVGQGIRYQGASQTNYVHLDGMGGKYQDHYLVYKQQVCSKCGARIKKIQLGGRGTYYCPKCQKKCI